MVVEITKFAAKQLARVPKYIREHVLGWVETLEKEGLSATRKISGYHDEPLKGDRHGQRSIRLNRSWRLIYREETRGDLKILTVVVLEITHHVY